MTQVTKIKEELLAATPMLDVAAWAAHQRSAVPTLEELEASNEIFSVKRGASRLYPCFQFDAHYAPEPSMADILAEVPSGARGWPLLSWLQARNVTLAGCRPREMMVSDSAAVCRAAHRFYCIED